MRTLLLLALSLAFMTSCAAAPKDDQGVPTTSDSERTEELVVDNLRISLGGTGHSVRFYFYGICDVRNGILLPPMNVQPLIQGQKGVGWVKKMFSSDSKVVISDDKSGIVRITIGNVSASILNTKLSPIKFTEDAQYNPDGPEGALVAIEHTTEVQDAMARLKVKQISTSFIGAVFPAMENLPHLPSSINVSTLEQALDTVAKTFGGIVYYGECTDSSGEKFIDLEYSWLNER